MTLCGCNGTHVAKGSRRLLLQCILLQVNTSLTLSGYILEPAFKNAS